MKNERDVDQLQQLLVDSMQEVPPGLQTRLKSLPAVQKSHNWSLLLTFAFIVPLFVWGGMKLVPLVTGWITRLQDQPWLFAPDGFSGWYFSLLPLCCLAVTILVLLLTQREQLRWR